VIPSELDLRRANIVSDETPAGVRLNVESQLALLETWASLPDEEPFYSAERRIRFDIDNNSFSYDDAPVLAYMLRSLQPERVVEIGSGSSSACMLDVADLYLSDRRPTFTFVDIDCGALRALLHPSDLSRVSIREELVQNTPPSLFDELSANDLLFVDSSHVLKAGSDVSSILFEILPRLRAGVVVHVHDIRYPFRYSSRIADIPLFWNEAYALRAFLQFNQRFEILFWTNLLVREHPTAASAVLPLENWSRRFAVAAGDFSDAGGSIYLRVVDP
jgi:hypothetical protein